jgi:aminoacrylate hydrolase
VTIEKTLVRTDDGCELHVEQEGSGPFLLLISGLGGSADFWDAARPLLRDNFRLVLFDHRGTGRSSRPSSGYTIRQLSIDTIAILDALKINRTHVVGHSTGGAIAQTLALDWTSRVDRLVISASWAQADYRFRLLFETRLLVLEQAGPTIYAALGQLLGYPADWINTHEDTVKAAIANPQSEISSTEVTKARLRMLLEHDRLDDLHRIESRTLVLGALDDIIVPIAHSRAMGERIPNVEIVEMTGGHFFPRTAPKLFASTMKRFLSERANA